MKKLAAMLDRLITSLTVIAMSGIVVLVFMNVVLRYAFNSGLTWSSELATYLFVWVIFLGGILAAKDDIHIKVDILTNRLPKGLQKIFLVVANVLVLIGLGILVDGGSKIVQATHTSISPSLGIPLSLVNASLVVFAIATGIILVYQTYKTLQN
ncbi:TRAP transporter small permease [Desulfosporosinus burensis]